MNTKILVRVPLFNELPYEEVHNLAKTLTVVTLSPGEALFHQGDPGDEFYIVITGIVEVVLAMGSADEKILATMTEGDFVGEMSLLESEGHRTAGARARMPSQLWVVTRKEFDALLHRYPMLAYSMVRTISKRLSLTNNAAFRDLQAKNFELQKAYNELKAAQSQIIEKERLERELQVARRIQMSILPDRLPEVEGYDFGGQIEPARQVGGDFYDVLLLDENLVAVFIGDVADKGVPSAIFMARAHALLTAESSRAMSSVDVLRQVNNHLTRMERSDQFVTVIYGLLDCKAGTFSYARAGHEIPLLTLADGETRRLPYSPGQAVGLLDEITLDVQVVHIPPGATMLIYTDGMTDGRNPEGEAFGAERLHSVMGRLAGKSGQEVCDSLLQTLVDYRGPAAQDDDVTLLAIHAAN